MGHLEIGQRSLVAEADLALRHAQLSDRLAERLAENLVALVEKILRIFEEELEIVLPDAVAVDKLVRPRCGAPIAPDMDRHVHQRLARNVEHLLPMRLGDESGLSLGKGAAAPVGIERVADA